MRQKFGKGYERDDETGLDYAQARYYSSAQGRFTSIDPGSFMPADPQSWNLYLYVQNNPLKFVDPTGRDLLLNGDEADNFTDFLKRKSGLDLTRNAKTGKITIVKDSKRTEQGTSKELAEVIKKSIRASEKVEIKVTANEPSSNFVDDFSVKTVDFADIKELDAQAPNLATALVGHFMREYYEAAKGLGFDDTTYMNNNRRDKGAHTLGLETESKIMSELTGQKEKLREIKDNNPTFSFIYTSVQFDVEVKTIRNAKGVDATAIDKVTTKKLP